MNPRLLAFQVLSEVESTNRFADALLGRYLAESDLNPADRALATVLVYGTITRQLTLDYTIAGLSSRRLAQIDTDALVLLRMGLFQLNFLDRVPAYAREGLRPLADADEQDRLSIEYSHPQWLVDLWIDELGVDDAVALMDANNRPAPTVLRALGDRGVTIERLRDLGYEAHEGKYAPAAVVVESGGNAGAAQAGAVSQGEASQLAVLFSGVKPGARVLDACAAPGGKTAYLAQLAGPDGMITAVDPASGARRRIEDTLRRCGDGPRADVEIIEAGIDGFDGAGEYDLVLVDAPCSGLGTLRQHPEIRWRRYPEDLEDLAARQARILDRAAAWVRPGGCLVYSTCTIASSENDAVVDDFLSREAGFEEAPGAGDLIRAGVDADELVGSDGRLRVFPDHHDADGFFAARLQRRRG
jgi:16S rRNA (cytosine967-C5)-methyltransferase